MFRIRDNIFAIAVFSGYFNAYNSMSDAVGFGPAYVSIKLPPAVCRNNAGGGVLYSAMGSVMVTSVPSP